MRRFHAIEPGAAYAVTLYAKDKRDARREFRAFLYGRDSARQRLPRGCSVWES